MAGGGGSSCLRHYDALQSKINMRLTPQAWSHRPTFLSLISQFKLSIFLGMLILACTWVLELFHEGGHFHIQTSPLIYSANQWTGSYMVGTAVIKVLSPFGFHLTLFQGSCYYSFWSLLTVLLSLQALVHSRLISDEYTVLFLRIHSMKNTQKHYAIIISQRAWMHFKCIFETSHTASQRHLKEG